jgi:SAM-dependent methyltransferase
MSNKIKEPSQSKDLEAVKEHYMDYPYPYRNPEDEKSRMLTTVGEYLGEMNHWLFKGKEDFKKNFRILIAGGGTGDSSTFLGEQLKNTEAEIVYLDFSKASMEIAKKRAEIRGIKNIKFVNESILNLPNLGLGKFDYINCSGVLHHLESPSTGLKLLKDALTERGGMEIMIYAKYGRTGVYQVQEIMRMVNEGVTNRAEEVMNGKIIMNSLPSTNWYVRGQDLLADHIAFGDIGLYDMFLHKQDRAYSIPEMYEFVKDAGLNFVEFAEIKSRLTLKIENFVQDFSLLAKIKSMPLQKQQAMCELISGAVIKHTVFLSNKKDTVASVEDLNNVPYFYLASNIPQQIADHLENSSDPEIRSINFTLNSPLAGNVNVGLPVSIYTKHVFKELAGYPKSLREIFDAVKSKFKEKIDDQVLLAEVKATFEPFFSCGAMLLRDKSVIFHPELESPASGKKGK